MLTKCVGIFHERSQPGQASLIVCVFTIAQVGFLLVPPFFYTVATWTGLEPPAQVFIFIIISNAL